MSTTPSPDTGTKVIVLTGASGYLGQHCLRALIEQGHDDIDDLAVAVASDKTPQVDNSCDREATAIPNESSSCLLNREKIIIYALVHQSSSKTELSDAIRSYYDSCDEQVKRHYQQNVSVITVALDLTSPTACDEWFESLAPQRTPSNENRKTTIDCCIHSAALSSPSICEQQPEYAMSINVPTYFLQQLFRNNPHITIIALSTDQVYDGNIIGDDRNHYYNESSKCEPCNVYGASKVALESYLIQQQSHYPQAKVLLLRSSIILGPKAPFSPKAHTTFYISASVVFMKQPRIIPMKSAV